MFRRRGAQKPSADLVNDFKNKYAELSQPVTESQAVSNFQSDTATSAANGTMNLGSLSEHYQAFEGDGNPSLDLSDLGNEFGNPSFLGMTSRANDDLGAFWPANSPLGGESESLQGHGPFDQFDHLPTTSTEDVHYLTSTLGPNPYTSNSMYRFDNSHHHMSMSNMQHFEGRLQSSYAPSQLMQDGGYPSEQHLQMQSHLAPAMLGTGQMMNAKHDYQVPSDSAPAQQHKVAQAHNEGFRYHAVLKAPRSMARYEGETPPAYLNKRQPYTLNIRDTTPQNTSGVPMTYRTTIRIAFDGDEYRSRPGYYWDMFSKGRGISEAGQRGGPLQAVEFVRPEQSVSSGMRARVDFEKESFDGFTVKWSPLSNGSHDCNFQLRLNFLSTDFSLSKGVKGIPLRLCAKTEVISSSSGTSRAPEISYCKVKTFRDHGAERKLANDRQHVEKIRGKILEQIEKSEGDIKGTNKRRRSDSVVIARPSKKSKHDGASSASSDGWDAEDYAEDDLQAKLRSQEAVLASQLAESLLSLRGQEQDDPELHPVDFSELETAPKATLKRTGTHNTSKSSNQSPSPSVQSCNSMYRNCSTRDSRFQSSNPFQPTPETSVEQSTSSRASLSKQSVQDSNPQHLASPPDASTKIMKVQVDHEGNERAWIDVLGAETHYKAPPEREAKPVACFYVKAKINGKPGDDKFYRALYIYDRSQKALAKAIASKFNMAVNEMEQIVKVKNSTSGTMVLVDDDVVAEIPEGQDMDLSIDSQRDARHMEHDDEDEEDGEDDGEFGIHSRQGYRVTLRY